VSDQPDLRFNQRDLGHGADGTILHPVVAVATAVAIVLVLTLPRKYVVAPLLLTAFVVPRGQEIYFIGQHWYLLRIIILTGVIRLARARFQLAGGLNSIDKIFALWAFYRVMAILLTNGAGAAGEQFAFWIQAYGGYFLLRHLIQDVQDIARVAGILALVAAILGVCMLNEHIQHVNVFGYLGGAPLLPVTRDGHVRAQVTFGHPILAGCFGATLLPLFVWLWRSGKSRLLAASGIAGSTLMVLFSASSTPVLAYAAGVGALFAWPIRRSMRAVRWGIVLTLAACAMVMKAPVWFIIAHINVTGSSGGYDRAKLIDVCLRHFKDWWLIGSNQYGTWDWDMWDLSNQFVAEAEVGGLVSLACFIAMISRAFSQLGTMRRQTAGKQEEWLFWTLGAVLLSHIFAYFGVSYWDQTQVWWFAFLSIISAAVAALKHSTANIGDLRHARTDSQSDAWLLDHITGNENSVIPA
jgi:hypothetical protein